MALIDLWTHSRDQLKDKHVHQIIAVSGDGKLLDGKDTSAEFRTFLAQVPSGLLARYADECLNGAFSDSGLALQDVMNQVGARLGFAVTEGRYRGTSSTVGFDGMWRAPGGHTLVVEVKTTDAYRIDLGKLAGYRKALVASGEIAEDASSVLIVVGRQDTGDLEAQIRGSRYAWSMRLVSVDALLRLVKVKEEVDDPQLIRRMHEILVPREFTRLDEIVDILFSAAEDIRQEEAQDEQDEPPEETEEKKPKFTPVAFHEACIPAIEAQLGVDLLKRTRTAFSTADGSLALACMVSREHTPRSGPHGYWFAFHPHQREFLTPASRAYVAFGLGSEEQIVLMPFEEFSQHLDTMHTTERDDRFYWHVQIFKENGKLLLNKKKGEPKLDVTRYLLPSSGKD